jgi:molybdenum cofactor synthesis domain-containing protein
MSSAGILIIGDEILHGEIKDQNGPWLIEQFNQRGITLKRCSILPDNPSVIAEEIRRLSDCDYIVTTGGIGPTHDDRTIEAVAKAFDRDLEYDESMLERLRDNHGSLDTAQKKMALRPVGARFYNLEDSIGMAVQVENVYVFPGFPELLKPLFFKIEDDFEGTPISTETIETDGLESDLAALLEDFQKQYPELQFGSYPHTDGTITLKIRGRDTDTLAEASEALHAEL